MKTNYRWLAAGVNLSNCVSREAFTHFSVEHSKLLPRLYTSDRGGNRKSRHEIPDFRRSVRLPRDPDQHLRSRQRSFQRDGSHNLRPAPKRDGIERECFKSGQ